MKEVKIEIKNRWTGSVIFSYSSLDNTILKTLLEAVKAGADLSRANLSGVNLSGVNLRGVNLRGANLCDADLRGANLCDANLCDADLRGADLCDANLCGADLRGADLRGANLSGVNLSGANLCDANRRNAKGVFLSLACPSHGSFIAWKKCKDNLIVKLRIPEDAVRTSATGIKCRCNKAEVLGIENIDGTQTENCAHSSHNSNFIYIPGTTVEVSNFCDDRWQECAPGIHFFVDREQAVRYDL